jgi:hypothetical protein
MAQIREARVLAQAIRRHGEGLVHYHGQRMVKALVQQTDPLVVELMHADVQIEEGHLLLGSWARWYDKRYGIKTDDTVVLVQLAQDDDWFVVDVVGNEDFDLGDSPDDSVTGLNYNTGSGHIVATVPYLDDNGVQVGVIALYDAATLRSFAGTAAGGTDSGGDTSPSRAVTPN